jgi:hypothetical protein
MQAAISQLLPTWLLVWCGAKNPTGIFCGAQWCIRTRGRMRMVDRRGSWLIRRGVDRGAGRVAKTG